MAAEVVVVVVAVAVVVVEVSISYCSGSGSYNSSAPVDALEHQHGARDLDLRDEIEQLDYGGVARGGRAQPKVMVTLGVGIGR